MAVMSPPPVRPRRLRPADRVAFGALLALAVLGPSLGRLAVRTLEPRLTTALVWVDADVGPLEGDGTPPTDAPGALDPWGRPFRWETRTLLLNTGSACLLQQSYRAASDGPDAEDPADDVVLDVVPSGLGRGHALLAASSPGLPALLVVGWLAATWRVLRVTRRRSPPVELALVLATAAPAAAIAWAVACSERGPLLAASLPQVVPGAWAITLSTCGLALIAAAAVRLASRPEARP